MKFNFVKIDYKDAYFLGRILNLVDSGGPLEMYVPSSERKLKRSTFDGVFTFVGVIEGVRIGIIYNDFRSFGSSLGVENSNRMIHFIRFLDKNRLALIYLNNSIGVRLQDGRRVFSNTFSLIPTLKSYIQNNFFISASLGYTLGLSAVLYSMSDYRLSLKEKGKFNLTGPEVVKIFFGPSFDFDEISSGERMNKKNQLVQDIVEDYAALFERLRLLFSKGSQKFKTSLSEEVGGQLENIQSQSTEFFSGYGKSLKVFLLKSRDKSLGIIMNPYNKGNMMTVTDIQKFRDGLLLFKKLKVPFVNFVDTPGGDPRQSENDKNIARAIYDLSSDIIDYPFPRVAVIVGRCFGGSSILSMPPFFGGDKIYLVEKSQLGIMSPVIISKLLEKSPSLFSIWKKNTAGEDDCFSDFSHDGLLNKIIKPVEISSIVEKYLSHPLGS